MLFGEILYVESQLGFPMFRIWTVTEETGIRKNRTNLAIERNIVISPGKGSCRGRDDDKDGQNRITTHGKLFAVRNGWSTDS